MGKRTKGLELLRKAFQSRMNSILIHGEGAEDFLPIADGFGTLRDFVVECSAKKYDIVFSYDVAMGIQFPDEQNELRFRKLVHLDEALTIDPQQVAQINKQFEKLSAEERAVKEKELQRALANLADKPKFEPLPKDPLDVISLIQEAFRAAKTQNLTLLIFFPHAEAMAQAETSGSRLGERASTLSLFYFMTDPAILPRGSSVVVATEYLTDLPRLLHGQRGFEVIALSDPDEDERLEFMSWRKPRYASLKEIARLSGGLTTRDLELLSKKDMLNPEILFRVKAEILEGTIGDLIKITEPRWGFDKGLGGHWQLKEFFRDIIPGLRTMDPRIVPPGVHLYGPPGTGKSAFAECLAWELGIPFVEILSLFNMYVGESERNALRLTNKVTALAPCVVFIDEADQNEAPRGSWVGDSGVGNRVRKVQFQIMGDQKNRGRVIWLMASNRPDLLDPAYKRSGRGSIRAPMLLPDDTEMADILRVMPLRYDLKTVLKTYMEIVESIRMMDSGRGQCVSGADIEEMSLAAYRFSQTRQSRLVEKRDYVDAVMDFVPHEHERGRPCPYQAMEEMAVRQRSSNRLLSKRGQEIRVKIEC